MPPKPMPPPGNLRGVIHDHEKLHPQVIDVLERRVRAEDLDSTVNRIDKVSPREGSSLRGLSAYRTSGLYVMKLTNGRTVRFLQEDGTNQIHVCVDTKTGQPVVLAPGKRVFLSGDHNVLDQALNIALSEHHD